MSGQRRVRLSIDLPPELRRRLKIAAASHDVSVRAYVQVVLSRALAAETDLEQGAARAGELENRQWTEEEQQQGHRALEELERFREALASAHGKLAPESWELINASRDERTGELLRSVEE